MSGRSVELLIKLFPVAVGALIALIITLAVAAGLFLIQRMGALMASRSREYLADAGAVDVLRDPDNLGRAIARVTAIHMRMPDDQEEEAFYQFQRSKDFFIQPELTRVQHSSIWHSQPSMVERLHAIGVSSSVLREVWPKDVKNRVDTSRI
jgi:Zn-dependent protease with chaperone function